MEPRSRSRLRILPAVLIAGAMALALVLPATAAPPARRGIDRQDFHDQMRKLWEDHITWTRLFIVSFAADLPDLDVTTQRLLQNQVDIGDAFRPFYGRAAADELTQLLTEHILGAAALLAAAKAGDTAAFEQARDAWYANAEEIAAFLHEANPRNWPLQEMRSMMREHLDLTLSEAANRLAGNFAADVADYERVHLAILEMADMLSDGIIRQFPKRFAS
ncbi:MAG TPA: hypothetical protein VIC58_12090 [Actinomycetota bacterium]